MILNSLNRHSRSSVSFGSCMVPASKSDQRPELSSPCVNCSCSAGGVHTWDGYAPAAAYPEMQSVSYPVSVDVLLSKEFDTRQLSTSYKIKIKYFTKIVMVIYHKKTSLVISKMFTTLKLYQKSHCNSFGVIYSATVLKFLKNCQCDIRSKDKIEITSFGYILIIRIVSL